MFYGRFGKTSVLTGSFVSYAVHNNAPVFMSECTHNRMFVCLLSHFSSLLSILCAYLEIPCLLDGYVCVCERVFYLFFIYFFEDKTCSLKGYTSFIS